MKTPVRKIYLASKSPRRRELLRQIGVEFELLILRDHAARGPDVSEEVLPDERAEDYVARVTLEKAQFARQTMQWRKLPPRPVLAADTTVVLDGRILGKPADEAEAIAMMQALSGRTHQVLTHVVVLHGEATYQVTQRSDVAFASLSEQTIRRYCATTEPYDKAGGYGIQGQAALFIEDIAGSHSGIMGLPLYETGQLLKQAGMQIL
ncbi:Maf-like protein [Oxalicibacterium flavum]|uniref:dTTP/UTP pyrophosphatase n=1 Tax=Oxalicibacterium flavum TaxID=179467 RepID=A0A8J2UNI0_9BURK|nr:Maf family protein [Oxalicibacterium flavum]GGC14691.1 Maf-like protein [Oxalicibacterium flavum]